MPGLLSWWVAAGCGGSDVEMLVSPAGWEAPGDAVQFVVHPRAGSLPVSAWVRAVDAQGATVPADARDFVVDGETRAVGFDLHGYGLIEVDIAGPVRIEGGAEIVETHGVESAWPGLDLGSAWPMGLEDPRHLVSLNPGMAVASEFEVWWVGSELPPHPVLVSPSPILGIEARDVGVSSPTDLLVWTADEVHLLEGRVGGGLGTVGRITAEGHRLVSVDAGDLTGDRLPDLAMAWVDDNDQALVDVWVGDGRFEFRALTPWRLDFRPDDLAVADADGSGVSQVTVLHDQENTWDRYAVVRDTIVEIGPRIDGSGAEPGSRELGPAGDINADGGEDVSVIDRLNPGSSRNVAYYDLRLEDDACAAGVAAAQCAPEFYNVVDGTPQYVALGDADGDGPLDLWVVDLESQLWVHAWRQSERRQVPFLVSSLPGLGPIAAPDVDDDGVADLALATDGLVWQRRGTAILGDSEQIWTPRTPDARFVRGEVLEWFSLLELDEVPETIEAVILTHEDGDTRVKVIQYTRGKGRAPQVSSRQVFTTKVDPEDMALCGNDVWFAANGRAFRLDVTVPTNLTNGISFGKDVSRVDCGEGPDDAVAAILSTDGMVSLVDSSGNELSSMVVDGAKDVVLGDLGPGAQAHTCETEGCRIEYWPFGAEGEAALVISDELGTRARFATGSEVQLGGFGGPLTIADVDGNGHADLVGVDPDRQVLFLHRSTGASIATAETWLTPLPIHGAVGVADGDGDGWLDLWWADEAGDLRYSQPQRPEVDVKSSR